MPRRLNRATNAATVEPLRKPACRAACAKLTPCATPSRAVARRTRSTRSLLALASCSNAVCSSARKGRSGSFCGVAMSDLPSAPGVSLRYPLSTNQLRRDPLVPPLPRRLLLADHVAQHALQLLERRVAQRRAPHARAQLRRHG